MSDCWCDGHLDLAYLAVNGRDITRPPADLATACITLPALREGFVQWIFGTIFTEMDMQETRSSEMGFAGPDRAQRYVDHDDFDGAERAGLLQLACYENLERAGEVRLVRTGADIDGGNLGKAIRVVLLMEGADPIRSPADVTMWHARGVRLVGLSWALGSRYSGGNHTGGSLTAIGRDMVVALDALGIVHDVSHLSDASFDELLARAKGRVIASHSNCRALLGGDNQRHLTDRQIRTIAERGGIVGLNLYSKFLASDGRATIDDCVRHIEHVVEVTGRRDVVALGSDADGGFPPTKLPEGLDRPSAFHRLADALRTRGWSDAEADGFTHGNWLRLLRETL